MISLSFVAKRPSEKLCFAVFRRPLHASNQALGLATRFDFLPQINGLFFRLIAHLRHHKAVGHVLVGGENRAHFGELLIHQGFGRQAGGGEGYVVAVFRRHFRL